MRRTKIVCTIGPSVDSLEAVGKLIQAGMNVARLNFSHGDHALHRGYFDTVRAAARELDANIAVMMDLQGPKIRTGPLRGDEPVFLTDGATVCITTRDVPGDSACVSTTYDGLPRDLAPGARILIADGALELEVDRVAPPDVFCTVLRGGLLGEHKGINLPGVAVSAPSLTEKDVGDLHFGLALGVDYVALSFVRDPDDIRSLKAHIEKAGKEVPVIAKIERPEALECLEEILGLADGLMVARGDLGVEVEFDEVPQIQKRLIRACNRRGVPVITATQMLESMIDSPRPTRAEVTDVANAVYDGSDAVMLSGETAMGRHAVEAVEVMARVVTKADHALATRVPQALAVDAAEGFGSFASAIGEAVHRISETLDVARIVCFTQSGYTVRAIARCRPRIPITAITLSEETCRRCALLWGVDAVTAADVLTTEEMIATVDAVLLERGLAAEGDTVIITAGTPLAVGGRTNLLKLHTVGEEA